MNDMNSFSKYQLAIEEFLHSKGERKYTHDVCLNVIYEGDKLETLSLPNTNVLFDFNDNNSNRIFVWELAHASNEYYEDFKTLYQSFEFDRQNKELIIRGMGSYGKYKVTLY